MKSRFARLFVGTLAVLSIVNLCANANVFDRPVVKATEAYPSYGVEGTLQREWGQCSNFTACVACSTVFTCVPNAGGGATPNGGTDGCTINGAGFTRGNCPGSSGYCYTNSHLCGFPRVRECVWNGAVWVPACTALSDPNIGCGGC